MTTKKFVEYFGGPAKVPRVHLEGQNEPVAAIWPDTAPLTRPNPKTAEASLSDSTDTRTVRARKFVILSAGTFGTPLLLERSGIGDRKVLEEAGVPVLHHLPMIGCNFQDHQCCLFTYESKALPEDTFKSIYNGTRSVPELMAGGDMILSWNGVDASAKIRPTESEVKSMGPNFENAWNAHYRSTPAKPLACMILINGILTDPSIFPQGEQYFTICYLFYDAHWQQHISGPHIDQQPDFRTGYLTDPNDIDLEIQVWAYKKQREIARRMSHLRIEIPDQHPDFPQGSKVRCNTDSVLHIPTEKSIEYSEQDDEMINEFIYGKVGTTSHPIGMCEMASMEDMGIVDERLSVHGVKGLKIADLSIVPENVSGNTMSTALLIGERAADIFAEDLKLES
ncbi:GMC oxidoreductase-domain-containing protein [Xylariaceae sp. FL0255]|nr:GMC oxidoreductase-domain-containing protein [Xylariaceae sp. FL0255]